MVVVVVSEKRRRKEGVTVHFHSPPRHIFHDKQAGQKGFVVRENEKENSVKR